MSIRTLSWQEHFTRAAGLSTLVTVGAARVTDPQTQAELSAVAKAIDRHIEKGVAKVTAELETRVEFIDPVNPTFRS